ncbi:ABC transporter permease [Mycobacterium sp. 4D054]|uniref:ABC transporter permease n=1 Tax=unclassified Mycobacterium TaxID=2642494 RepID=UPI0021B1D6CA|nr:ABC transporter permease subunit [Mycobacterium sp. SMC-8]UXA12219.1 ABC transporter permease subunit [Mycobacterium sp. SMC-8]
MTVTAVEEAAGPSGAPGTQRRRPPMSKKRKHFWLRVVAYGGILGVWQITAMIQGPFFLPTIPEVLAAMPELVSAGYAATLAISIQQLIIGFALSLAIAIPLGALMGASKVVDAALTPFVNALYVTSKESLLPLLIIIFGAQLGYLVSVVVFFAVFFPIMNTAAGVRYVEGSLSEMANAFCTSKWRMYTRIYLPAAAPFVVAGIRLGLGMAIKGMVIAELWISIGTGHLLRQFGALRELDLYFALAILVIAIALFADKILYLIETRLFRGTTKAGGQ